MKDCKYNKMARELKEKHEATRSSETSNHVFHNTGHEIVNNQDYISHYLSTNSSAFQHPTFSHEYSQHLYIWLQPPFPVYQHFTQIPGQSTVASSPVQQEQQHSSQPQPTKQENTQEHQAVNNILPSQGHIFAITGGSNQEHENKRARREYERRVHTVSPRVPLNRPAWFMVPITFDENVIQVRDFPHIDAFVATANIAGFTVHNILIDNGSSIDILFIKPFEQMNLDKRMLEPARNSLFGFGWKKIDALRKKAILVSFVEGEKVRTETITFNIVNKDYPYATSFGKGVLSRFKIIIKQSYLCMKMTSPLLVFINMSLVLSSHPMLLTFLSIFY